MLCQKKTIQIVVTLRYKMFFSALKIVFKKKKFPTHSLFILFFCTKTNAEKNFFCLSVRDFFFSALDFVQKKRDPLFPAGRELFLIFLHKIKCRKNILPYMYDIVLFWFNLDGSNQL